VWPFPNPADLFGAAVGGASGWAWDKVIQGIYTWFANGLLLLMEWVWGVLDTASTPRLTDDWFRSGLVAPLAGLALAVTVAMMLNSAVQAGFGGRPELIVDAVKESAKSIVATAVTVVVMDVMIQGADAFSNVAWQTGRGDARKVLDGLASTMSQAGPLSTTFLGPLALLFGMIGLLVTTVVLFMRSSLLYLVAAFAPIVWASSVSPVMRGSGRRLVHVTVALVLAKPAITITLVVGLKLVANAGAPGTTGGTSGAAALGSLVSGFACFAIGGLSPWVVFRLLPSVEQAAVSSGIVGGWGRAAMTGVQAGLMVKSLGATAAASAATRSLPQMSFGQQGSSGFAAPAGTSSQAAGGSSGSGGGSGGDAATRPTRSTPPPSAPRAAARNRSDDEARS
jgi:hypothetical protein